MFVFKESDILDSSDNDAEEDCNDDKLSSEENSQQVKETDSDNNFNMVSTLYMFYISQFERTTQFKILDVFINVYVFKESHNAFTTKVLTFSQDCA